MIRYTLACDAGHRFDSWFQDSSAFDALADRSLINCPTCLSSNVAKTIMAPAVVARDAVQSTAAPPMMVAANATDASATKVALLDDGRKEVRGLIKAFRDKVLAETTDVGARFPEEARRMHEGEIPHHEIRGQATLDEAKALLEDGIMILPLPIVPEELN